MALHYDATTSQLMVELNHLQEESTQLLRPGLSSFRTTHQRSSGSVDYEHIATLREVDELNVAEKSYESPLEQRPDPHTQVDFSFSFPHATQTAAATTTVPRISRSDSQTSQRGPRGEFQASVREKLAVFKDGDEDEVTVKKPPSAPSDVKTLSRSSSTRNKSLEILRSVMYTASSQTATMPVATSRDAPVDINDPEPEPSSALHPTKFLTRLNEIARKRKQLLRELDILQEEEEKILAQLTLAPASTATYDSSVLDQEECASSVAPQSTIPFPGIPAFPIPGLATKAPSPSKLPLSRPRSGPPTKSMSQPRNFALSRRPPLADKTKDSLELFGSTALPPSADHTDTPLLQEQTYYVALPTRKIITGSERTTRVALNFADADETAGGNSKSTTEAVRTSKSESKSRNTGRDGSAMRRSASLRNSRGREVGSRVAALGATPSRVRSVEIPHTVTRKRWDF